MVADYVRFNRAARALLADPDDDRSLRAFLDDEGFSRWFVDRLLVPQAAAVWSADPEQMWSFPARFLVAVLRPPRDAVAHRAPAVVDDRGRLGALRRGAHRPLRRPHPRRARRSSPSPATPRTSTSCADGEAAEEFDEVVIAAHADQALALLTDPSAAEAEVLGAFPYQPNEAVLHTDRALLPRRRAAWAAWNYHLPPSRAAAAP